MSLNVGVMTSRSGPMLSAALDEMPDLDVTRIDRPEDLGPHMDTFDVFIVSNDLYGPEVAALLGSARRLRWLQIVSSGYDNLALHGAPGHLLVSRGGPSHARAVAEHAVMLALALVRRLPDYERNRIAHRWDRQGLRQRMGSLEAARALILGFGAIGREIARRLRPFGTHITGVMRSAPDHDAQELADRIDRPENLPALLPDADVLFLALPLTPHTRQVIGRRELASLKPTAFVVNVARGGVLDNDALLDALGNASLAGAALDVFDEEPLPPQSPLWDCEKLILSPHVAGAGGDEGTKRTIDLVKENIARFQAHQPLLNPIAGYPREGTAT